MSKDNSIKNKISFGYNQHGRGIGKLKRKINRKTRHIANHLVKTNEDPVIEQPKKYHDFWWIWL